MTRTLEPEPHNQNPRARTLEPEEPEVASRPGDWRPGLAREIPGLAREIPGLAREIWASSRPGLAREIWGPEARPCPRNSRLSPRNLGPLGPALPAKMHALEAPWGLRGRPCPRN